MPGIVLNTKNVSVDKRDRSPCSNEVCILVQDMHNLKQIQNMTSDTDKCNA